MTASTQIPKDEIQWCSWGADGHGRTFLWRGEVYRGIRPNSISLFRAVLEGGVLEVLARKNLIVATEPTDLSLDEFPLVLRHERIPFVTYPCEWSFGMLKDAALLVLRLNRELLKHGLILGDCHPFNVLFRGPNPVFVDVGAIAEWPSGAPYPAYAGFVSHYLYPLLLQRRSGLTRVIKALQEDELASISREEYHRLSGALLPPLSVSIRGRKIDRDFWNAVFRGLYNRVGKGSLGGVFRALARTPWFEASADTPTALARLAKRARSVRIVAARGEWSAYYEDGSASPAGLARLREGRGVDLDELDVRASRICRIIQEVRPSTLIDLAGNRGLFSLAAVALGVPRVVCADHDLGAIEALYRSIRKRAINILPVCLNVMLPGAGSKSVDAAVRAAQARLRCEMALALAVTHHLSLTQGVPFDVIARTLSGYATRHLLVEFMPWGLGVRKPSPGLPPWYTLESFVGAFRPFFRKIDVQHTPAECNNRVLLVCEKSP